MLDPVRLAEADQPAQEIGRALRSILDWLARSRTRTVTVDVRIFGREVMHVEVDRGHN